MIKSSIIISFYNKIEYLEFILISLENQHFKDFEIIIADDGSSQNIVEELEPLLKKVSFPVLHIWQEDFGFRKNKILNQAILKAASDYLIFIDGDCVLHPEFVSEHFFNKKQNVCLTGRRVNLSEKITSELNPQKIKNGFLQKHFYKIIYDGIFGKSFDVEKGFYFKNKTMRKIFNKKQRGILGCNFSLYKKDLLDINGFDERYKAPSIGEDSDIQFRLELNNVKVHSLNNIAIQYHLYHKLQPRPKENLLLFEKIKKQKSPATKFGIKTTKIAK